jgi:hypothetical protein
MISAVKNRKGYARICYDQFLDALGWGGDKLNVLLAYCTDLGMDAKGKGA